MQLWNPSESAAIVVWKPEWTHEVAGIMRLQQPQCTLCIQAISPHQHIRANDCWLHRKPLGLFQGLWILFHEEQSIVLVAQKQEEVRIRKRDVRGQAAIESSI